MRRWILSLGVAALLILLLTAPMLSITKVTEKDSTKSDLEELEKLFTGETGEQVKQQNASQNITFTDRETFPLDMMYNPPYMSDLINNTLFSELSMLMNISIDFPSYSYLNAAPKTESKIRHVIS